MIIDVATPVAGLRDWPARRWVVAAVAAFAVALAAGVPTDVIPNPLADRTEPVTWWSYPTLAATAVLAGLVIATEAAAAIDEHVSVFPAGPAPPSRGIFSGRVSDRAGRQSSAW